MRTRKTPTTHCETSPYAYTTPVAYNTCVECVRQRPRVRRAKGHPPPARLAQNRRRPCALNTKRKRSKTCCLRAVPLTDEGAVVDGGGGERGRRVVWDGPLTCNAEITSTGMAFARRDARRKGTAKGHKLFKGQPPPS